MSLCKDRSLKLIIIFTKAVKPQWISDSRRQSFGVSKDHMRARVKLWLLIVMVSEHKNTEVEKKHATSLFNTWLSDNSFFWLPNVAACPLLQLCSFLSKRLKIVAGRKIVHS